MMSTDDIEIICASVYKIIVTKLTKRARNLYVILENITLYNDYGISFTNMVYL